MTMFNGDVANLDADAEILVGMIYQYLVIMVHEYMTIHDTCISQLSGCFTLLNNLSSAKLNRLTNWNNTHCKEKTSTIRTGSSHKPSPSVVSRSQEVDPSPPVLHH